MLIWLCRVRVPYQHRRRGHTHVSTGAIFGIGCWTGKAHGKVVAEIILAWVVTLPAAIAIAFLVAKVIA